MLGTLLVKYAMEQKENILDKFKATWVSHSSIKDFLNCPRLYYFRNVYRDPITGHKITLMQPPLALGGVVHDVIESLSVLPVENRFKVSPLKKFETMWAQISGKKGGFTSRKEESVYKERGRAMIQKIIDNPGPLANKAVKIKEDLPWYWLSEDEQIILSGKIDWLEYIPEDDSVHIIDFKTSKRDEAADSLQLPIYYLLVQNTQKRKVNGVSYWYLERDDAPITMGMPDLKEAEEKILQLAKRIKLAKQLNHFKCKEENGCRYCIPMEQIAKGKGELVGLSGYKQDIYILNSNPSTHIKPLANEDPEIPF